MNWLIYMLGAFLVLSSYRIIRGPSLQDRLMGLSMVSAQIVLLMCVLAIEYGRSFYLDAAILYALLAFTEMVAYIRFAPRDRRPVTRVRVGKEDR